MVSVSWYHPVGAVQKVMVLLVLLEANYCATFKIFDDVLLFCRFCHQVALISAKCMYSCGIF